MTPSTPTNNDATAHGLATKKQEEATAILGSLATQQLDFPEHLGILNEEQWKWLLKRRLGGTIKNLPALVKTYRQLQPTIAALDSSIVTTNRAIDQLTYRLYGLSKEEIATVEEILFH